MLAADAELQVVARLAAALAADLDQLADALDVERGEGIVLEDAALLVLLQERRRVVAAEAEGRLRQVVGAEGEELRRLGDLAGAQAARGSSIMVPTRYSSFWPDIWLTSDATWSTTAFMRSSSFLVATSGIMISGITVLPRLLLHLGHGLEDRAGLHLVDLRVGDAEPHAAMAEHRVELVQLVGARLDLGDVDAEILGDHLHVGLGLGQELVQRRIEQADGDRQAGHDLEQPDEVLALHRQDLGQRRAPALLVVGQDHLAHRDDAVALEEHVLGAAEADALGAELARLGCVRRRLGVGADAQRAELVGPGHQLGEVAGELGLHGRHDAQHDLAGAAVDGDDARRPSPPCRAPRACRPCASMRTSPAPATQGLPMPRATTAAWLVMPPVEVRMPSAACMPWMSSGLVSRRTRITFSPARACFSASSAVNTTLPEAAPGEAGRPLAITLRCGLGIERRMQQLVERGRLDARHRLLLVDQALAHHVDGDLERRLGGALAVARLQHVELAALHGELDVLHVAVVLLELSRAPCRAA